MYGICDQKAQMKTTQNVSLPCILEVEVCEERYPNSREKKPHFFWGFDFLISHLYPHYRDAELSL